MDENGSALADDGPSDPHDAPVEPTTVAALVDELEALERTAPTAERRERIGAVKRLAADVAPEPAIFGRTIVGFDRSDAGEAFLGAVLFGIPMAVEGGTQEAGAFLAAHPLALVGTVVATVALVVGILYVADIQDVRIHRPLLGLVPRRLVGVLGIATLTSVCLLAGWGRLSSATAAVVAGELAVATLPTAMGAALGDILPGS
jgi:uncharacterized membrane protein